MNTLLDKLLIFLFCSLVYLLSTTTPILILPILLIIIFASFLELSRHKTQKTLCILGYCILSYFLPTLLYFLPLILYYHFLELPHELLLVYLVPISIRWDTVKPSFLIIIAILCFATWLIKIRTTSFFRLKSQYIALRDQNKESEIYLKNKNEKLLEKQDYAIYVATLNERNRIARDIHDVVGHVLSSSILQLGALLIQEKQIEKKEKLMTVKDTLDTGMDRIRNSIHHLYDNSIDLKITSQEIIDHFQYCDIEFSYDANPVHQNNIKYAVIAILEESLTNITKHSSATKVTVTFKEHPALYQLIISDNGRCLQNEVTEGIGILNMKKRIHHLQGNINITTENGFKIFITIPKEVVS